VTTVQAFLTELKGFWERGDTVNKGELINEVARKGNFTKKDAKSAVELTLETIKKNTKREGVQLVGFGTFLVTKRKARKGRNPRTGQEIKIPAGKSVRFRPGKEFKEML
jgi:nucleoid DNA-binding protein